MARYSLDLVSISASTSPTPISEPHSNSESQSQPLQTNNFAGVNFLLVQLQTWRKRVHASIAICTFHCFHKTIRSRHFFLSSRPEGRDCLSRGITMVRQLVWQRAAATRRVSLLSIQNPTPIEQFKLIMKKIHTDIIMCCYMPPWPRYSCVQLSHAPIPQNPSKP